MFKKKAWKFKNQKFMINFPSNQTNDLLFRIIVFFTKTYSIQHFPPRCSEPFFSFLYIGRSTPNDYKIIKWIL